MTFRARGDRDYLTRRQERPDTEQGSRRWSQGSSPQGAGLANMPPARAGSGGPLRSRCTARALATSGLRRPARHHRRPLGPARRPCRPQAPRPANQRRLRHLLALPPHLGSTDASTTSATRRLSPLKPDQPAPETEPHPGHARRLHLRPDAGPPGLRPTQRRLRADGRAAEAPPPPARPGAGGPGRRTRAGGRGRPGLQTDRAGTQGGSGHSHPRRRPPPRPCSDWPGTTSARPGWATSRPPVPTPPRCRPDASFDLLCNAYLLDLIPFAQVRLILGEFHRVLAPGVGWCCST
jgi:hypothetical protein